MTGPKLVLQGAVLVNRETREGVAFYSEDMIPLPESIKDRFQLIKVYSIDEEDNDQQQD